MKIFFTIALIAIIGTGANAKTYIVTCQNNPSHFLPVTVNAHVGDTIHWKWVAGVHIVGPINATYIPSGAPMFNGPVDTGHRSFKYKVTAVGNYNYDCHPAGPHGEVAKIVVAAAVTGITPEEESNFMTMVYPNPSAGKFQFANKTQPTENNKLEIYTVTGSKIYQTTVINSKTEIDLGKQSSGVYFLKYYNGEAVLTKKIVIR